MKKVFRNVAHIAELFITQKQDQAMTPLEYIQYRGKGRRFYFRGDTCYSYRDSFPLARIKGDTVYVKNFCPSVTTKKQRNHIAGIAGYYDKTVIYSDDLKTPLCLDLEIELNLDKLMRAKKWSDYYKRNIVDALRKTIYPITKSKFPLLFDKKHEKVKQMLFSNDPEIFNLAKKIIKQQKLV